jgi:hypothetical protein
MDHITNGSVEVDEDTMQQLTQWSHVSEHPVLEWNNCLRNALPYYSGEMISHARPSIFHEYLSGMQEIDGVDIRVERCILLTEIGSDETRTLSLRFFHSLDRGTDPSNRKDSKTQIEEAIRRYLNVSPDSVNYCISLATSSYGFVQQLLPEQYVALEGQTISVSNGSKVGMIVFE